MSGWAQGQMERPEMWLPGEAGSGVGGRAGREMEGSVAGEKKEARRGREGGGGRAGPPVILMPAGRVGTLRAEDSRHHGRGS